MQIIIIFFISLVWSFVPTLVKYASSSVDFWIITFCRFSIGVVFLLILFLMQKKKAGLSFFSKWIILGASGKTVNYLFENIALSIGDAYTGVLSLPLCVVFVILGSLIFLKEKLGILSWSAVILCFTGIFLVTWNGARLDKLFGSNFLITLLFIISASGAALHMISQKILIESMDSLDMNLSVFLLSSLIMLLPLPFTVKSFYVPKIISVLSLIGLGAITGITFYLYANALKKVSLIAATLISNSSVLFILLWSYIFFNEKITLFVAIGSVLMCAGIIILNLPKKTINKIEIC